MGADKLISEILTDYKDFDINMFFKNSRKVLVSGT